LRGSNSGASPKKSVAQPMILKTTPCQSYGTKFQKEFNPLAHNTPGGCAVQIAVLLQKRCTVSKQIAALLQKAVVTPRG